MSQGVLCRQDGCKNYAFYRYTWPGRDESAICTEHHPKLCSVAKAIGLYLQILPVSPEEHARSLLRSEWATDGQSKEEP